MHCIINIYIISRKKKFVECSGRIRLEKQAAPQQRDIKRELSADETPAQGMSSNLEDAL